MYTKVHGIVLRETSYKEADKILTVLTAEEGKRTIKARGCRRKGSRIGASAQLLVYSEMTLFAYRDYYTMNEAGTLEEFRGLRADLVSLSLGAYFAEVLEAVSQEGVPQGELLSLLLNALYALDRLQKSPGMVKAAFELRLMCLTGYEPLVDACAACGLSVPEAPRFHLNAGVLHCAGCRGEVSDGGISLPLAPGTLSALRHIVCGNPKRLFSFQLDEAGLAQLGAVTEAFLLTQLERGFHTLDYYKRLSSPP